MHGGGCNKIRPFSKRNKLILQLFSLFSSILLYIMRGVCYQTVWHKTMCSISKWSHLFWKSLQAKNKDQPPVQQTRLYNPFASRLTFVLTDFRFLAIHSWEWRGGGEGGYLSFSINRLSCPLFPQLSAHSVVAIQSDIIMRSFVSLQPLGLK